MLLMMMLYMLCSISMVMVLLMLFMKFDYMMFMLFEIYTVLFLYLVLNESSSYERSSANIYLMIFGYVMSFSIVMCNNLMLMSMILLMLGLSKLPMFSLHMWLPKVHVEASMLGSMILASGVLKLGIMYCWNFSLMMMIGVLVVMSLYWMIGIVDGKSFAAYSSVLHMTCCVISSLIVMLMIGYMHIVLSPLMFMSIYVCYVISGSRYYMKLGMMMMVLWLVNFGLPFMGGFFAEVYFMMYNGMMLLMMLSMYMVCSYIMMKSINEVSVMLFYMPWFVLYMLLI